MGVRENLEGIFDMYESESYDYLLSLGKDAFEKVYSRLKSARGEKYAMDYISIMCSALSACDGEPSEKEFDFFMKVINNKFSWNYKGWCDTGNRSYKMHELLMMHKNIAATEYFDNTFNLRVFTLAITLCACDGKINRQERDYFFNYIPLPKSVING